jgi:large subunit ribosomal protein L3
MKGMLFVQKKEMTSLVINDRLSPVTLLKLLPQEVARIKTQQKDGYDAVVIGAVKKSLKKPEGAKGVKEKYMHMGECKTSELDAYPVGTVLSEGLLEGIEEVTLCGTSKGKGFQGVIKRYHFAGMPATHGHKYTRHGGSLGNRKPRRTQKGHPAPGHMGDGRVTLKNRKIVEIFKFENETLIAIKGSLPGSYNGVLSMVIEK